MSSASVLPEVPEGPAPAEPGYPYDVFVSYSDADEAEVERELLPPLAEAGLKLIHKLEFMGGIPREEAHAEAARTSRYTIVVLTQEWCDSQWENLDASFVRNLDPGARARRLLPLLFRPCRMPEPIALLTYYDFSTVTRRSEILARLLRQLGRSPRLINEAATQSAQKTFIALAVLMKDPRVREKLRDAEADFRRAAEQLAELTRHKHLHDLLQQVEGDHRNLLSNSERFQKGESTWDDLEVDSQGLAEAVTLAVNYACASFRSDEVIWTQKLQDAGTGHQSAAWWGQDIKGLNAALRKVSQVLGRVPSKLNDDMFQAARRMELGKVVERLRGVGEALNPAGGDEAVQKTLREFRQGVEALGKLAQVLDTLVSNHNCLQAIDNELLQFGEETRPDPADLAAAWPDLGKSTQSLSAENGASWAAELRRLYDDLVSVLQGLGLLPRPAPAESVVFPANSAGLSGPAAVQGLFRKYSSKARRGFNLVDSDLRSLCEQLEKVRRSLEDTLLEMQRHA
jgi:hypothetical protein